MTIKRKLNLAGIAALILLVGLYGVWEVIAYIRWSTTRNRALPDGQALVAAVEYFKTSQGRLPSQTEFALIPPSPRFKITLTNNPETQSLFGSRYKKAEDVLDPYGRPFQYEASGDAFLIRSLGCDGIPSKDDIIFQPK